jgi:hypothetical protein
MASQEFLTQGQPYGFTDDISNIWTTANTTDSFFATEEYQYPEFPQHLAFDNFPHFEPEKASGEKSPVADMSQSMMATRPLNLPSAMSPTFAHRYSSHSQDLASQSMFTHPIAHPTPVESFDRSTAKRTRVDPQANKHEHEVVDRCYSQTGSQSTCCSSCSDGEPCVDPECAEEVTASCEECPCGIPKCSCPEHDTPGDRVLAAHSEVLLESRLQDWNNSTQNAWTPQSPRNASQLGLENNVDHSYGLYHGIPFSSVRPSPAPTTPSIVNMSTPFSPNNGMPTPSMSNYGTQPNSYDPNLGVLSGAGAIFQPTSDPPQWMNSELNVHDNSQFTFSCAWNGCDERFQNNNDWLDHCFNTHVASQMMVQCPIQQDSCPQNIAPNFLSHMRSDHGYDFTAQAQPLMCPAPNCDPNEAIPNAGMLQNHFSRAHAMPTQGSLLCEVKQCNATFHDLNEFSTHLTHQHALTNEPEVALSPQSRKSHKTPVSAAILPSPSSANEDDGHTCQWSGHEGNVCGITYESSTELHTHIVKAHLATLDKKSGYKCCWKGCTRADKRGDEKCGFSQRGKLERHMATHTNCKFWLRIKEMLFLTSVVKCCECKICHKTFSAEQALAQHMNLHSNEKPWQCKYCDKRFPQQSACSM